jgi:hypothetical protein
LCRRKWPLKSALKAVVKVLSKQSLKQLLKSCCQKSEKSGCENNEAVQRTLPLVDTPSTDILLLMHQPLNFKS